MTAAPHSPLFLAVRQAIQSNLRFALIGNDFGIGVDSDHAAQAALEACLAEEMRDILKRLTAPYAGPESEPLDFVIGDAEALLAKLGRWS
jgi:hypothetical protein